MSSGCEISKSSAETSDEVNGRVVQPRFLPRSVVVHFISNVEVDRLYNRSEDPFRGCLHGGDLRLSVSALSRVS